MIEGKGLVCPNIDIIQALLKSRNWDASALASRSELDLRTVESVLRGDRKQWAVMEKVAGALGVPLSQIVVGLTEGEAAWPSYSGIRIHKDWEPSWPAIESARESVIIIDSFFLNEYGRLGPALRKSAAQRHKPLKISIYMASPNRSFGAQRIREKDLHANELLDHKTNRREEDHYRKLFVNLVAGIKQYRDSDAEILLFEYVCMPSLRIVLVDEIHLFWGWFPLAAQNPTHVCLYLQRGGQNAADNELSKRLTEHIEKVAERSTLVQ